MTTPATSCPHTHGAEACLECKARRARVQRLALLLSCPSPAHWFARPGVPCRPAADGERRGTACGDRVRYALENPERAAARATALEREERSRQRAEWRAHLRDSTRRRNAAVIQTIHRAALQHANNDTATDRSTS